MKTIFMVLILAVGAAVSSWAQGLVYFSSVGQTISTNSAFGGSATGNTTPAGAYYFALFCSQTATSVNGQTTAILGNSSQNFAFNDTNWTLVAYATNTFRGAGQFASINGPVTVPGVAVGAMAQFVIIGWSASIGPTIAAVKSLINNGSPYPHDGVIGQSAGRPMRTVWHSSLPVDKGTGLRRRG